MKSHLVNAMSVDVEDYFQVSAFEHIILKDKWATMQLRVQANTERILELFERRQVKATFFVLGWIAQQLPSLVRKIHDNGHEVACHSFWHEKVYSLSAQSFKQDTQRGKSTLEDITGKAVLGYRAPTFSITPETPWAYTVLEELGFAYSSSVYPVKHDTYGWPQAPRFPYTATPSGLIEVPISTRRWLGRTWPSGGGGYFRLLPYALSRSMIEHINLVDKKPSVFYFHPWELDPKQPRIHGIPFRTKVRHYLNLSRHYDRLECLTQDFKWDTIQHVFISRKGSQAQSRKDSESRAA